MSFPPRVPVPILVTPARTANIAATAPKMAASVESVSNMDWKLSATALSLIFLVTGLVAAQSTPPRKDIPAIAKAANGAIVSIVMSDKDGKAIAQGSGFLISKNGMIVTNYHVIAEGNSAVVKLPDGAFYVVDGVLASDKHRDVAIIKAHGENFRTLTLGNSDQLQVGEEVVAIGNPLSLESTVSNGIVSGIRTVEEQGGKFLQVTTPISPGSSGGPLFNMAGEVVGITTLYLKGGENLNFAIPINDAKSLLSIDSKVHNFPNESEVVEAQTSDRDERPSVRPSAHDYYKQIYDAGGFSNSMASHVCFSDDSRKTTFFTFEAWAYDKMGFVHAVDTQPDAAYVTFFDDDIIGALSLPSNTREYLQAGGRLLGAGFYSGGVKVNGATYEWDEDSWVVRELPADPNASVKTMKTFRLSIEPTTLRYAERVTITLTAGSGQTMATKSGTVDSELGSGTCERIPAKPN
jgi:V8-like Glu-specific endopeptidase